MPESDTQGPARDDRQTGANPRARRHECFGWWSLLVFVALGIGLEALHGFKVAWYLDVGEETRRLMWRLAHAHGTFLALVHFAFAATVRHADAKPPRIASPCLFGASLAIPSGFFLGGTVTYGGDPGPGIALLPLGAILLLVTLTTTAFAMTRSPQ